jgi:hypothetical protein
MPLWVDIEDKVELKEEKYRPPHCLPHKFPFTKPITDEPCHFHDKRWRMGHYILYCKILKCKNYDFMINQYKEYQESKT